MVGCLPPFAPVVLLQREIEAGAIGMWSGSIGSIPAGWLLCDGSNGTPDMRDRFVRGAGSTIAPGLTGGTAIHTHTDTTSGHDHLTIGSPHLNAGGAIEAWFEDEAMTLTTDTGDNTPEFYALLYLMRS